MKTILYPFLLLSLTILASCKKNDINSIPTHAPDNAHLILEEISFRETNKKKTIYFPGHHFVFTPDNPNFSMTDPDTWTGNAEQYVTTVYTYQVSFHVKNIKRGIAKAAEADLYLKWSRGQETIETIQLGDIRGENLRIFTTFTGSTNKELKSCEGDLFW